ncbi:MAG: HlyD family efflux transporter periplasmic adaptor subunit [Anaerolineales bacterium]
MRRNWIAGIGLALLAVVGGLLYLLFFSPSTGSNQAQQADEVAVQTTVARLGDLTLIVSGSGELVPVSEVGLGFQERGQLLEMNVQVGDQVQKGETLARLKVDRTEADRAADIASAQLAVLTARGNLDQAHQNAQLASAQALVAYENAQLGVEKLGDRDLEKAVALQSLEQAQEAVKEAEMNLYIANSTPSQQAIDTAYASLLFKEKELKEIQARMAQAEYQFKSASNQMDRDRLDQQLLNLRVQLANQQVKVESARFKYESMDLPPDEIDLSVAEARLTTAKAQLEQAQKNWQKVEAGPADGDLAMAEAQLAEAQSEWEHLKNGPDPDQISLLDIQLEKAELTLAMLQAENLILDLNAPMNGIVVSIDAQAGDRVGNQTVLTLADVSQMMLEVFLDETDLASVHKGDRAEITFDAFPDSTFSGEVVQLDPELVRAGNSQAVRVLVLMDSQQGNLDYLPLGLNAGVDIISGEATNAVLVSLDALHQDAQGGYIVYVVDGETLELRPVQIGLADATTAEIISGVEPGEQVAIGNLDFDQEQVDEH